MNIDYDVEYCGITINEFPIQDNIIDKLTEMDFWDFIRADVVIKTEIDEYMTIQEFIKKHLTPDQKRVIHEYIRKNMNKIEGQFFKE